jgi:hypothetical protein
VVTLAFAHVSRPEFTEPQINQIQAYMASTNFRELPLASQFPDRLANWTRCMKVPVIGSTCIELYVIPHNVTVGARIIVSGRIIMDQYFTGSRLCVDEKTLISLITLIPPLIPFKPVIDAVLFAYGFIPANVFSVCLEARHLNVTRTQITGQAVLHTTLMCWRGNCLQRGFTNYGNFTINVPIKQIN